MGELKESHGAAAKWAVQTSDVVEQLSNGTSRSGVTRSPFNVVHVDDVDGCRRGALGCGGIEAYGRCACKRVTIENKSILLQVLANESRRLQCMQVLWYSTDYNRNNLVDSVSCCQTVPRFATNSTLYQ